MPKEHVNPASLFPSVQHGFSQVVVASGVKTVFGLHLDHAFKPTADDGHGSALSGQPRAGRVSRFRSNH